MLYFIQILAVALSGISWGYSPFYFENINHPTPAEETAETCANFSGGYEGYCEVGERRYPYHLSLSQLGCAGIVIGGAYFAINGKRTDSLATSDLSDTYVTQLFWSPDKQVLKGAQHKSTTEYLAPQRTSQRQGHFEILFRDDGSLSIESQGRAEEQGSIYSSKSSCRLWK